MARRILLARHGRDRLEPRAPLAGARRPAAERDGRAQARALAGPSPRAGSRRSTAPTSPALARRPRSSLLARAPGPARRAPARGRRRRVVRADDAPRSSAVSRRDGARRAGGPAGTDGEETSRRWGAASSRRSSRSPRPCRRHRARRHARGAVALRPATAGCAREDSGRIAGTARSTTTPSEAGRMRWLDSTRGGLHEQVQG